MLFNRMNEVIPMQYMQKSNLQPKLITLCPVVCLIQSFVVQLTISCVIKYLFSTKYMSDITVTVTK